MVQAVSTGQVSPVDGVRIDNGPARALGDVPELARHLPSSTTNTNTVVEGSQVQLSGEMMPLDDGGLVLAVHAKDDAA